MLIGETLRAQLDVLRFPSLWENSNIANAQRKKEIKKINKGKKKGKKQSKTGEGDEETNRTIEQLG